MTKSIISFLWIFVFNNAFGISKEIQESCPQILLGVYDAFENQKSVSPVLISDDIRIRVEGLTPGQFVALRMSMGANQAEGHFSADADGLVDVAKLAPQSGSYRGIDSAGLIWSMRPTGSPPSKTLDLTLEVVSSDQVVLASRSIPRSLSAPGTPSRMITDSGFVGQIFLPPGKGVFPSLIVLGGGEGGLSGASYLAAYYASYGYAALAVAYFGAPGLPSEINRIPIEYFKTAVDWLKSQSFSKGQRMGITGGSRGAEAALAIASKINEFSAVVADVGNALPLSGYDFSTGQEVSPWTYKGRDLPFQKNLQFGRESYRQHPGGVRAFEFKSTRNWKILSNPSAIEAAILPVEDIKAPILFNTAEDDALWPSYPLSKVAYERRIAKQTEFKDEFYVYKKVGHVLGTPPGLPSAETYFLFPDGSGEYWELGGSAGENARAQRESAKINLRFLNQYLK